MADRVAKHEAIERVLESYRSDLSVEDHDLRTRNVDVVAQHIHEHLFQTDLRIKQIRREHNISRSTFSQRFKRVYGMPPYQYIQHHRMEAARRLFKQLDVELFSIALSLGYDRYRTFARAVKRHFGCCPSTCQKKMSTEGV